MDKRDWIIYKKKEIGWAIGIGIMTVVFVPCKQLWIRNVQTIESQIEHVFYIT